MSEAEILNAIEEAHEKAKKVNEINGEILLSAGAMYGVIRSPSWSAAPSHSGPGNPVARNIETVEARREEQRKALRAAVQAHQEAWEKIAPGLGIVSGAEAEAIRLRAVDGYSYSEAADLLGCTKGRVWQLIREAAHRMAGFI